MCLGEHFPDDGIIAEILKNTKAAGNENHIEFVGIEFLKSRRPDQGRYNLGTTQIAALKIRRGRVILLQPQTQAGRIDGRRDTAKRCDNNVVSGLCEAVVGKDKLWRPDAAKVFRTVFQRPFRRAGQAMSTFVMFPSSCARRALLRGLVAARQANPAAGILDCLVASAYDRALGGSARQYPCSNANAQHLSGRANALGERDRARTGTAADIDNTLALLQLRSLQRCLQVGPRMMS
jgi:hypothetical protein